MKKGISLLAFTVFVVLGLNAAADTHYVDLTSPSPTPPYTNWPTAATNIQDAVDAATAGDTILVTNGVYQTGGKAVYATMTNRVALDKPLTLQSVSGPSNTVIQGVQTQLNNNIRCVYLTNGSKLIGFTLTKGGTQNSLGGDDIRIRYGGGVWSESLGETIVSNCIIKGNIAVRGAGGAYGVSIFQSVLSSNFTGPGGVGGGAMACRLVECSLIGNSAQSGDGGGAFNCDLERSSLSDNVAYGGGGATSSRLDSCMVISNTAQVFWGGGLASSFAKNCLLVGNQATVFGSGGGSGGSELTNCTIIGNMAYEGGGAYLGGLRNCIVYSNTAPSGPNVSGSMVAYSCVFPLPSGLGNISNAPVFVDALLMNFRLESSSPCINAGNNSYVTSATDIEGNQRISGGTVDIGAYEFQSPASVLSYAWAQQNGLPTDGSADLTDADGDGANNWQEWRADTVPMNAASALLMGTATNGVTGLVVSWASVATRNYWLERASDLGATPSFQSVATNIPGVAGTKTFNDTSATNGGPYFYRVGVH
jgi:hypothetical protein